MRVHAMPQLTYLSLHLSVKTTSVSQDQMMEAHQPYFTLTLYGMGKTVLLAALAVRLVILPILSNNFHPQLVMI